jgi:large subunit ribosomal protein L18
MNPRSRLNQIRRRRIARVRAGIFGTKEKPRLAVARSNKRISAQLIDDAEGRTLAHVSGDGPPKGGKAGNKVEQARRAGELLAKKALETGVKQAIFDRRRYQYHGRVKAFVEGAREAGLKI